MLRKFPSFRFLNKYDGKVYWLELPTVGFYLGRVDVPSIEPLMIKNLFTASGIKRL